MRELLMILGHAFSNGGFVRILLRYTDEASLALVETPRCHECIVFLALAYSDSVVLRIGHRMRSF
jgi:hypothetical protein